MELQQAGRDPGNVAHWRALGLELDQVVEVMNARLGGSFEPPSTLSRMGIPSLQLPGHPEGTVAVGGPYRDTTAFVTRTAADGLRIVGVYPLLEQGVEVRARLGRVAEFDHGLMARVDAEVQIADNEYMGVTFFDPLYARDWPHYAALDDRPVALLLSGLAYTIGIAKPATFPLDLGLIRKALEEKDITELCDFEEITELCDLEDMTVITRGAKVFVPAENANPDDWCFQGAVVAIDEREICGQAAWLIKVRLTQADESDFVLPILCPHAALRDSLPAVGDEVDGVLWLQGSLWGPA